MSQKNFIFTSESVYEGQPDKIADQISDAILDAHLSGDKESRVACETLVTTNRIIIAGEITSNVSINYEDVARDVVKDIGYNDPDIGFDYKNCEVEIYVHAQSQDISQGVTEGEGLHKEQGAGDQGMMFGFAVAETNELMPMPIITAHRLVKRLSDVRKSGEVNFLRPDSKSQVYVRYEDGKPKKFDAIVISTQHTPEVSNDDIKEAVIETVIKKIIPVEMMDKETKFFINPTGRFVIGGPHGDTGLTGRKIIVDTYGGMGRHGGGAFSGKDSSKVDRSAAYMGRYIAKNIVAAGLAYKCEVQLAYAIGVADPVSVMVDTFGSSSIPENEIAARIKKFFDMKPLGIIKTLDLKKPQFKATAAYGHFGRENEGFRWELSDKYESLK